MGATSVTGAGPGDSQKRVAYLSETYNTLEIAQTTGNKQDLIPAVISGGGGDFHTTWELVFVRLLQSTDPNDPGLVDTTVAYDPIYQYALGVINELGPVSLTGNLNFVNPSNPIIVSILNLLSNSIPPTMTFSPDGGITEYVVTTGFSLLDFGSLPGPNSPRLAQENNSFIGYDSGTNFLATRFLDSSVFNVYFIIARRKLFI